MNMNMKVMLIASVIICGCGDSTSNEVSESKVQPEVSEVSKISNDSSMKTLKSNSKSLIEQDKKKITIESHAQKFTKVIIGGQTWMKHNLNVNKFQNGDVILQAKSKEEWKTANKNKQPAWCYYDNKSINGKKHGKIYNFYAINDKRELAPKGWHIASKNEFLQLQRSTKEDDLDKLDKYNKEMERYENEMEALKGSEMSDAEVEWQIELLAQAKPTPPMKKNATISMFSKDAKIKGTRGTDKYGFSATSGGYRDKYGNFKKIGEKAIWKCSTRNTGEKKWGRSISKTYSSKMSLDIREGAYVRCIKN